MARAANLARRIDRAVRGRLARPQRRPVIVLGKEKSGTTAIAALLAEHAGCGVTLDIPGLWGSSTADVRWGRRDLKQVVRSNRLEFSRLVIKQPSMTYLYPQVRATFPEARLLMIVRDPRDNIRSVFNRVGLRGDLDDIEEHDLDRIPEDWRWHFERPGLLQVPGETYIEQAANRWNLAADAYLHQPADMLLLRYEDFLADKSGSIERCAEALGLPARRDISGSVDKQYQSRGQRGVKWPEFFGERNLQVIERTCASRMKPLGYAVGDSPKAASPAAAA
jgi:sulfotransferase family protein